MWQIVISIVMPITYLLTNGHRIICVVAKRSGRGDDVRKGSLIEKMSAVSPSNDT